MGKMINRMVNKKTIFFLLFFIVCPMFMVNAQTNQVIVSAMVDMSQFPQWSRDLRRWEIIAFGSFPFAMLTATFGMDMYRWSQANGMDLSDTGRRYAPWPLKSAGAVDMTNKEYETTMIIAASLSGVIAMADLVLVQIKRHKARQRAENLPVGTTIIVRRPWPDVPVQNDVIDDEEGMPPTDETDADASARDDTDDEISDSGITDSL